jgi:hypothetical protein
MSDEGFRINPRAVRAIPGMGHDSAATRNIMKQYFNYPARDTGGIDPMGDFAAEFNDLQEAQESMDLPTTTDFNDFAYQRYINLRRNKLYDFKIDPETGEERAFEKRNGPRLTPEENAALTRQVISELDRLKRERFGNSQPSNSGPHPRNEPEEQTYSLQEEENLARARANLYSHPGLKTMFDIYGTWRLAFPKWVETHIEPHLDKVRRSGPQE